MTRPVVRPARHDDLERAAEIHAVSYPDGRGIERHARALTDESPGDVEGLRVVELGGQVVGHAVIHRRELWLGGRPVPAFAIGSVGVAPEARRRGVASALLEALHQEVADRGGALSVLDPFRPSFYARFGYGMLAPLVTLRLDPAALESRCLPDDAALFGLSLVRIDGPLLPALRALYEGASPGRAGLATRTEDRWRRLVLSEEHYWLGAIAPDGALAAYAAISLEPHAEGDATLRARELIARDAAALRAMLGLLARSRSPFDTLELTVPQGDPLLYAALDAAGSRRPGEAAPAVGVVSVGPMARGADIPRLLASRGYAAEGDLGLVVTGGGSSRSLRLSVRWRGPTSVVELDADSPPAPAGESLTLSRATLSSIASAGILPREAASLGLVHGTPHAIRRADEMFAGPRFQCLDPF